MSSFHEDSTMGGENLNQSNTRIMSPIFMNKSAFGSPRIEELSGPTKGKPCFFNTLNIALFEKEISLM